MLILALAHRVRNDAAATAVMWGEIDCAAPANACTAENEAFQQCFDFDDDDDESSAN